MKAVTYSHYGEPADVLRVEEIPEPMLGAGDVLVRVQATPFLQGSLLAVRGRYRAPRDVSSTPPAGGRQGYEGVGFIEAIGPAVDASRRLSVGQRVAFFPALGAWSELAVVPATFVMPLPDAIPTEIAAQLHINPMTATMLVRAAIDAGVGEGGDRAIVLDAGGSSVSKFVTAMATARSIPVVSVVRRPAAADELAEQFPGIPFVASDDDGWIERLRAATPAGGLFVGLDAVGGAVGSALLDHIAEGGTFITYGDLSGEPLQANALSFTMRRTQVRGLLVTDWPALPEVLRQRDVAAVLRLASSRPDLFPVAESLPLQRVADAARLVEAPGRNGLVLLRP